MSKKKNMQYLNIPMIVFRSKALSADEKWFYQYVLSYSNNTTLYASKKTIAKDTEININKLKAIREKLELFGLITVMNNKDGDTIEMVATKMEDFSDSTIDLLKGTKQNQEKKKKDTKQSSQIEQEEVKVYDDKMTDDLRRKLHIMTSKNNKDDIPELKQKPNLIFELY